MVASHTPNQENRRGFAKKKLTGEVKAMMERKV